MAQKTHIEMESPFVTTQSNTTGEFSEIVEVQTPVGHRFEYDPNRPIEFFMMTHEQKTTGGVGAQETFNLANALADSPHLDGDSGTDGEDTAPPSNGSADLVLYSDGVQVAPDAVRYHDHATGADQFDYTDGGAVETLDVYYVFRDSFQINGEYYVANEQSWEPVFTGTRGLHVSNIYNDEEMYTFHNAFTVGPKEKLKFQISTAVDLANWNSNTEDGTEPTAGAAAFSSFRLPVTIRPVQGRKSRSRGRGPGTRPTR